MKSEQLNTRPQCTVLESELWRMLGYPAGAEPSPRALELIEETRAWYAENGHPWTYQRKVRIEYTSEGILLDGIPFPSRKLATYFRAGDVHEAWLLAVGAGKACAEEATAHWQAGRPDAYFFMEVYGSAIAEHLLSQLDLELCQHAASKGKLAIPHYSPGYDGWDVSEQQILHEAIIKEGASPLPETIKILSSGMILPRKTLFSLVGLLERSEKHLNDSRFIPCRSCPAPACSLRLQAYKYAPSVTDRSNTPAFNQSLPPLSNNARYSVSTKALAKWADERLEITSDANGAIRACFRFEGSTCSNLGHPLAFNYTVILGSPDEGYPILSTRCEPAEDDTGHTKMCAYLNNAEATMSRIADSPPVIGKSLDAVLNWEREPRQTGCYCDKGSRAHKWGLVLETIHFTLSRKQQPIPASSST